MQISGGKFHSVRKRKQTAKIHAVNIFLQIHCYEVSAPSETAHTDCHLTLKGFLLP